MTEQRSFAHLREGNQRDVEFRLQVPLKTVNEEYVENEIVVTEDKTKDISHLIELVQKKIIQCIEASKDNPDGVLLKPLTIDEINLSFSQRSKPCKSFIQIIDLIRNLKCGARMDVQIFNCEHELVVNAPQVREIELPPVILSDMNLKLSKFCTRFTVLRACRFYWSKSLDKVTWIKVGTQFNYVVKNSDVGYYLRVCCVPYGPNNMKGPSITVISENTVVGELELPSCCPFQLRHAYTQKRLSGANFRVVSYNILADKYAKPLMYCYCPPDALSIIYRRSLLWKELIGYKADIIALQEVDRVHYTSFFRKRFEGEGFQTIFNRKGNRLPEGLLCAYNSSRYKLLESRHIVYNSEIMKNRDLRFIWKGLQSIPEVRDKFMAQMTSLQVNVLLDKKTRNVVIFANTHLYYHPTALDVRLVQTYVATSYVDLIKSNYSANSKSYKQVGVVFCGDFNCDYYSPPYEFLIRGVCEPSYQIGDIEPIHELNFICASGTPLYTNYTDVFKGCLDYIFVQKSEFEVKQNVPVTPPEVLSQYEGLPNKLFPSDHLSLVVDLCFSST